MFDLLLRTKTFTVEMIISKKVGNHFLLGNGSQPPKIQQFLWDFFALKKSQEHGVSRTTESCRNIGKALSPQAFH